EPRGLPLMGFYLPSGSPEPGTTNRLVGVHSRSEHFPAGQGWRPVGDAGPPRQAGGDERRSLGWASRFEAKKPVTSLPTNRKHASPPAANAWLTTNLCDCHLLQLPQTSHRND